MTLALESSQQLLGGYLHQDWRDEFVSAEDAVAAMIDGEPVETRHAAAQEIRALIAAEPDDAALRRTLIDRVGCYYDPSGLGLSDRQWLAAVAEQLAA